MGKVKNEDDGKPWFKPPPLESINVSSAELKGNLFLRLCVLLNMFTGLAGIFSAFLHLYILLSDTWSYYRLPVTIIRAYFAISGLLIVLQERENQSFFHRFSFLESWIGRGLFLILCASIMVALEAEELFGLVDTLKNFIAGCLATSGILYFSMGVLCFRELKIRELTQIRRKKQVALQAEQLSAHKSEIEKLLKETETKMQHV